MANSLDRLTVNGELAVSGGLRATTAAIQTSLNVTTATMQNLTATSIRGNNLSISGTKNFVHTHPGDPAVDIVYSCLEGSEAGTFLRGSCALFNGEASIDLPEHFRLVTSSDNITVQVTQQGCDEEPTIFQVVEKSNTHIVVKGVTLQGGDPLHDLTILLTEFGAASKISKCFVVRMMKNRIDYPVRPRGAFKARMLALGAKSVRLWVGSGHEAPPLRRRSPRAGRARRGARRERRARAAAACLEPPLKRGALLPPAEQENAEAQLAEDDRVDRDIALVASEPTDHLRIGRRPGPLAEDAGVDQIFSPGLLMPAARSLDRSGRPAAACRPRA